MKTPKKRSPFLSALAMLAVFETVAVVLWRTQDNVFYLFNFTYIGCAVALGLFLLGKGVPWARRAVQLLVGLYMLVGLGLIGGENMQIEGFWFYLFSGVSWCMLRSSLDSLHGMVCRDLLYLFFLSVVEYWILWG